MQNITKYLDNVYFQLMSVIIDPYRIKILSFFFSTTSRIFCFYNLAYFTRYRTVKILQLQAADDQYFPPDSEVIINLKYN